MLFCVICYLLCLFLFQKLAGQEYVEFNNTSYLEERRYHMKFKHFYKRSICYKRCLIIRLINVIPFLLNLQHVKINSSADRNFALAHFMKEKRCFPEGTDVKRVMDLYFQVIPCV